MLGHVLFTGDWWKNSLYRALRTAIAVSVVYIPSTLGDDIPYVTIGLAAAFGFLISFLTSLAGIPEADGTKRSEWLALLDRVVRTVAQAAIVACGTASLISEVDWGMVGTYAISAGVASLLLGLLTVLPEVGDDADKVTINTANVVINE